MFLYIYFLTLYVVASRCDWKYEMKDSANFKLKYSIISTRIPHKDNLTKNLKKGVYFDINIQNTNYIIYIKEKSPEVVTSRTEFYIYDSINNYIKSNYSHELVEGFITNEKYSSYVLGYIEDVFFYGKIQIIDTIYYIEKLTNYPELIIKHKTKKNAIVFQRTLSSDEITVTGINYIPEYNKFKLFKRMTEKGNLCSLLVLLDNSFITYVHGKNIKAAIKQALLTIDEANSLYRSTDFDEDGYPDNIGFTIKYFILLKSEYNSRWIPKYNKSPMDGRYYMNRFSRFYLLEDVCLGVAFTGQAFNYDIVGISYSAVPPDPIFNLAFGGICDRPLSNPYGLPLNTLAVSAKSTNGKIVPQYIFELSLCHEFGHSFGSDHDSGACDGYLMTAHAPMDQNRKHFIFSTCSKRAIMKTILNRGQCFDADDTPYCGNGIIETGEECDCGTIRDCLGFDICCVPRGRHNSCKIKREMGYQCHPSQGICCTNECYYRDLKKYDLDCKDFQKACPCPNKSTNCQCGVNGYCINNICNNEECTRIGAEECECPNYLKLGCITCCQFIGQKISCTPANKLTKMLIKMDETIIYKLKQQKIKPNKSTAYGFYEKFCEKGECVKLYFRSVKKMEYCLLYGQVGICSKKYKCLLPKPKFYKLSHFASPQKSKTNKSVKNISMKLLVILCLKIKFY